MACHWGMSLGITSPNDMFNDSSLSINCHRVKSGKMFLLNVPSNRPPMELTSITHSQTGKAIPKSGLWMSLAYIHVYSFWVWSLRRSNKGELVQPLRETAKIVMLEKGDIPEDMVISTSSPQKQEDWNVKHVTCLNSNMFYISMTHDWIFVLFKAIGWRVQTRFQRLAKIGYLRYLEYPRIGMHSDESNPTLMWNCEGYQVASQLRGWSVWANGVWWGAIYHPLFGRPRNHTWYQHLLRDVYRSVSW